MCLIIRHIRQNDTQATRLIDTRTAVITSKPILKDYNGDISKRWYIEYWLTNTTTDRQERVREWVSAKLKKELRYKFAEKRIKEIEEKYKELPKSKFDLPQNILRIQNKLVNLIDLSDLRDKSKSTYKTCVYHLCKYLKESKLTELSEIDIEIAGDFLQNMYSEYNANTVKNTLNHLKATFSEAMREKLITVNP
ncbi:MAG TPA: phage integrase SAM-like domain-containing protein, partial [Emticicia sp.]